MALSHPWHVDAGLTFPPWARKPPVVGLSLWLRACQRAAPASLQVHLWLVHMHAWSRAGPVISGSGFGWIFNSRTAALHSLIVSRDLDTAWEAVRLAKRPRVHTFLATSAIHMEHKLKMTPDQASHSPAIIAPMLGRPCQFCSPHPESSERWQVPPCNTGSVRAAAAADLEAGECSVSSEAPAIETRQGREDHTPLRRMCRRSTVLTVAHIVSDAIRGSKKADYGYAVRAVRHLHRNGGSARL